MNERIKELMQQAGTDTSGRWMSDRNVEKFAELLEKEFEAKHFSAGYIQGRSDGTIETVRECARLIQARDMRNEPIAHIYLLKTFGIEE